ncbi:MAG: hypothetical protein GWO41_14710, partial [candidate division Zixibacteria bacterium]|nr:hypothetical protein [candidate division Zixibacteria bacterium]NIW42388.1 hypothetical protein [candidate division Zixibacteria bacterium]NIX58339.1 hypothetical protein [candidate division Zixibacteria bacterium]
SAGFFEFANLDAGDYQLIAEKDRYLADTIDVSITDNQDYDQANLFLDALPGIKRSLFYSEHIDQWWPGPVYHAFFTVVVEDPDGVADIDSLAYLIPSLNFTKPLQATGRPDSFFVDIENFDLPGETLQSLVEEESFIFLEDEAGAQITEGPFFLHRIIEDAPVPESPTSMQTVSSSPILEWQPFSLTFEFDFVVQVFRISAGIPMLIHTSAKIPAGQTTYAYPTTLSSGSYYWTIGVRDRLHNFSRSKEASFIVP